MVKEEKEIKKMSFAEILEKHPKTIDVLLESGMHCVGCPMAMQETLEEGAIAHGLDPDEIKNKINEKIKKKENKKSNL